MYELKKKNCIPYISFESVPPPQYIKSVTSSQSQKPAPKSDDVGYVTPRTVVMFDNESSITQLMFYTSNLSFYSDL